MTMFKRILSFVLAIAFCFVFFCSVLFIAEEANHICSGENCPVCAQINICKELIRKLAFSAVTVCFALSLRYFIVKTICNFKNCNQNKTLVSLNVKLSN